MPKSSADLRLAALAFAAVWLVKVGLAWHWALLADEAWYLLWSRQPALGYYDQPPLIAWVLAAVAPLSTASVAVRGLPLLVAPLIAASLWSEAGDKARWLAWCALVPAVGWLTIFATPDALLLGAWAVALAAALRGGRGWIVAGLAAGIAFEAKHTGALLFPLLMAGAPEDLRGRWPWIGAGLAAFLALPNLVWNARHGWVTVRFQLGEGLLHPAEPGPLGALLQVVGQLGIASPLLGLCGFAWVGLRAGRGDRTQRLLWWTSAPLLIGFALAGFVAPGEAHWAAPAWIALGLALCRETDAWARASWLGLGLCVAGTAVVAVHTVRPLTRLPQDPAVRLSEGPVLGAMIARIPSMSGADSRPAVYTERYQEAGFIEVYGGIPAAVHPGCGRAGQQDLWGDPFVGAKHAIYVRPTTGGPAGCVLERWSVLRGPIRLEGVDAGGRPVGPWDLFELEAR